MFRFEIGVQSGNEDTLATVGRRSDLARLFANVRRLKEETGVIIHLDLVAGLPGETFQGFLDSLEALLALSPHHIQVEPLKVLKGSPMREIAASKGYLHSQSPPYKTLQTPWLSFAEICRIETVSRLLDLVYNNGRFCTFLAGLTESLPLGSFFAGLAEFWDARRIATALAPDELLRVIWQYCQQNLPAGELEHHRDTLRFDFCLTGYPAGRLPPFLASSPGAALAAAPKELIDSVVRKSAPPSGSRVRTFAARFDRDYCVHPFANGPVDILFVYISAPGQGLRVVTRPLRPGFDRQ
jgi:anaerobic magnesium-protoporphyrin IX monomethyl ester cyclase